MSCRTLQREMAPTPVIPVWDEGFDLAAMQKEFFVCNEVGQK